jgi:hypothetical protein
MKMKFATLLVAVIATLSGCATPYQDVGASIAGGYFAQRLGPNRFVVSFAGNGFTEPQRARDFAMLRAAEVTLEYHFTHFTIDGVGDFSSVEEVQTGTVSTTTGSLSPYGTYTDTTNTTYNEMPVFKPGARLTITCFDGPPTDKHAGRVFDASMVAADLRARYKL